MKSIFISLMLFVITAPVHAEQAFSASTCLKKFHSKKNSYQSAPMQPDARVLYFSNLCMPESAHSEDPRYFHLLQRMEQEDEIITIQASLSRQALSRS